MLEEIENLVFPESIEEFGYKFNENGELRNIKTNKKFLFLVRPEDRSYNQKHYEALGETIGVFIENELVNKYNLVRKVIPVGSEEDDNSGKSRIYLSDNAQECKTLLLLIQGSGVVRPGQWARQVIINESLELGTMFPYIRKAQELKWGIIIFNPNENYEKIEKDGEVNHCLIPGSETSIHHCSYVWKEFVKNSEAEKVLIVAHSYGGICTASMMDEFGDEFKSRVKGIALTDSVHSSGMIPQNSKDWFHNNTFNWIKSTLPLNEKITEALPYYGCRCFSAGHLKHEYTSGSAIECVFTYLQDRLKEKHDKEKTNQENKTDEQSLVASNGVLNTQDTTSKSTTEESVESPKGAANMQSQETSPASQKDVTSAKEMNESPKLEVQTQKTASPVSLEKDITSTEEMNELLETNTQIRENGSISIDTTETKESQMEIDENGQQEIVTNDNEEFREKAVVENNNCENQVATIDNASNENVTDSTRNQKAKNDGNSKEDCNSSIQEQTENSDQKI